MINALARNGKMDKIKRLYERMKQNERLIAKMDRKCFISLINASGHCGHAVYAEEIWRNDVKSDAIKYDSYLVASLIDCFARNGQIKEAKSILNEYEEYKRQNNICDDDNDRVSWMSLLSGCRNSENIELAQNIFDEIDERFSSNMTEEYRTSLKLLLSNIYAKHEKPMPLQQIQ